MREHRDALPSLLIRLALLIGAGIVVGLGIATAQYLALNGGFSRRRPMADEAPPAPALQAAPRQDLEEIRRRQERRLEGYEWSDRKRRFVRVPIERAMELLLEDVRP
jgi:hypothetical protein